MKKTLLSLLVIVMLGACGEGKTGGSVKGPTPEELYRQITEVTDYRDYQSWPEYTGMKPGRSPHGDYHKIYINRVLADALPLENGVVPDGGMIVKENYNEDKELEGLNIMLKIKGFNPKGGDWYWGKFSYREGARTCGAINSCIVCHAPKKENDYVFLYDLKKRL